MIWVLIKQVQFKSSRKSSSRCAWIGLMRFARYHGLLLEYVLIHKISQSKALNASSEVLDLQDLKTYMTVPLGVLWMIGVMTCDA